MDLINRQDAIDTIEQLEIPEDMCVFEILSHIELAIGTLPSAESEIIHCKDCRWGREVCGNIECFADTNAPPEYHGYEWFCPNGERI